MKKVGFVLLIMIGLIFFGNHTAFAEGFKIHIGVNDHLVDFKGSQALIVNEKAYSPIESLFNGLYADIQYDSKNKIYTMTKYERTMTLSLIDNMIITDDGVKYENLLMVINGITYAPVRLIGEYFGFQVEYFSKDKVVRIFNENHRLADEQFIIKFRRELDKYFQIPPSNAVYLTFDDGPNKYTGQILDILKKKEANATFFMIEENISRFPEVVKRMVQEGNYPGLHSVTHDKKKIYANPQNVAAEMQKTRDTLLKVTGVNSNLTRVPYGSKPYMKQSYRDDLAKHQYKMWDWTIDTEDWRNKKAPKKIVEEVKVGMKKLAGKGKPIVILMHDSQATVSVLSEIIDYIREAGYEPVSYSEKKHEVVNFWGDKRL